MYKKFLICAIGITTSLTGVYVQNAQADTVKINDEQAKIVVYRGNTHRYAGSREARIYLNDKQIANLEKNDYIEFCVTPEKHKISSHLESVLFYSDKNKKHLMTDATGASTYFIRINDDENASGELLVVDELNAIEGIKNHKKANLLAKDNTLDCRPFIELAPPIANTIDNIQKNDVLQASPEVPSLPTPKAPISGMPNDATSPNIAPSSEVINNNGTSDLANASSTDTLDKKESASSKESTAEKEAQANKDDAKSNINTQPSTSENVSGKDNTEKESNLGTNSNSNDSEIEATTSLPVEEQTVQHTAIVIVQ
ncbi:MAG: hypothetical protein RLZZ210_927 [Pseudomonadota bacterium]|jgi:hypothetical protein